MTIYLRNDRNRTIAEVEIYNKNSVTADVSACVNIEHYSEFLVNNLDKKDLIIEDFENVAGLRRWYWEVFMEQRDEPTHEETVKEIKRILTKIAMTHDLNLVTD